MTTLTHPIALADQLAAASADARHILVTAGTRAGVARVPDHPCPWLAEQAAVLMRSLRSPFARCCPHLGASPRVVHAAAWAPGVLACPACVGLLVPDATEDGTCDRCRQPAARLHAGVTAFGPILFGYGLCRSCAAQTGLAPRKPTA